MRCNCWPWLCGGRTLTLVNMASRQGTYNLSDLQQTTAPLWFVERSAGGSASITAPLRLAGTSLVLPSEEFASLAAVVAGGQFAANGSTTLAFNTSIMTSQVRQRLRRALPAFLQLCSLRDVHVCPRSAAGLAIIRSCTLLICTHIHTHMHAHMHAHTHMHATACGLLSQHQQCLHVRLVLPAYAQCLRSLAAAFSVGSTPCPPPSSWSPPGAPLPRAPRFFFHAGRQHWSRLADPGCI